MYIFDTNSLQQLFKFYPKRFPSLWEKFDELVNLETIISVKEVFNEIESYVDSDQLKEWAKKNQTIFLSPTSNEGLFISIIYQNKHFQQGLEQKKLLKGGPFADPFLIAKAKEINGTLVTEEKYKPNGTKIPNISEYFNVSCINLELLMERENWSF